MMKAIMVNVILLSVSVLKIILLNAVQLNVILLNDVATMELEQIQQCRLENVTDIRTITIRIFGNNFKFSHILN